MIVLDASVIAKWFVEEPKSSSALYYRDLHLKKKDMIIAPDIIIYELANFFRYRKDFTEKEITSVIEALENFGLRIIDLNFKEMAKAAIFARHNYITVYDASYVITAINFRCKFITADEKLYEKIKDLGFIELLQA